MKNILILLVVISLISCNSRVDSKSDSSLKLDISSADEEEKKVKTDEVSSNPNEPPAELLIFISDSLTDYAVPTLEDYDSNLSSYLEGLQYPYFCLNDYDGNGETDYGILLWSFSKELYFYIFTTANGTYHPINMGELSLGYSDAGIATILENKEKGSWTAFDKTIQVSNPGISVKLLEESRTRSYYWDGTEFVRFFAD